jgi:hypothetical protein
MAPGQGCAVMGWNFDSDCDDKVDECDKDQIVPTRRLNILQASRHAAAVGVSKRWTTQSNACVTD